MRHLSDKEREAYCRVMYDDKESTKADSAHISSTELFLADSYLRRDQMARYFGRERPVRPQLRDLVWEKALDWFNEAQESLAEKLNAVDIRVFTPAETPIWLALREMILVCGPQYLNFTYDQLRERAHVRKAKIKPFLTKLNDSGAFKFIVGIHSDSPDERSCSVLYIADLAALNKLPVVRENIGCVDSIVPTYSDLRLYDVERVSADPDISEECPIISSIPELMNHYGNRAYLYFSKQRSRITRLFKAKLGRYNLTALYSLTEDETDTFRVRKRYADERTGKVTVRVYDIPSKVHTVTYTADELPLLQRIVDEVVAELGVVVEPSRELPPCPENWEELLAAVVPPPTKSASDPELDYLMSLSRAEWDAWMEQR